MGISKNFSGRHEFPRSLEKFVRNVLAKKNETPKPPPQVQDKISYAEAEKIGFVKTARQLARNAFEATCDLGKVIDSGSVWILETDENGQKFFVKNIDEAGNIVRKIKASKTVKSESMMEKIKHELKTEIEKQDQRDGMSFEIGGTLGGELEVYDFSIKEDYDEFKKDLAELGYEVVSVLAGVATVQKKKTEEAELEIEAAKEKTEPPIEEKKEEVKTASIVRKAYPDVKPYTPEEIAALIPQVKEHFGVDLNEAQAKDLSVKLLQAEESAEEKKEMFTDFDWKKVVEDFIALTTSASVKTAEEKPEEQVFNSPEEATNYLNEKRKANQLPPEKTFEPKQDVDGKFKLVEKQAALEQDGGDEFIGEVKEEEPVEEGPQQGDYIIQPSGELGSKTHVSVYEGTSKDLSEEFGPDENIDAIIKADMEKNKLWSNVWYVDDHGGITPYTIEGANKKKIKTAADFQDTADDIDETAATELNLYAMNDSDLYRQMLQPIYKNLVNKKAQGIYNKDLALKAFMNFMATAAQKYTKEYSTGDKWFMLFPVEVRKSAAAEALEYFETEMNLGNYDNYLFKKYQKKTEAPKEETAATELDTYMLRPVQKNQAFDVFLDDKEIDTVFYSSGDVVDEEEVKKSLVEHDGYDPNIVVKRAALEKKSVDMEDPTANELSAKDSIIWEFVSNAKGDEEKNAIAQEINESFKEEGRYSDMGEAGSFVADGQEYNWIANEDEAERIATELNRQTLQDEPELFNQEWLQSYITMTETDRGVIANEEAGNRVENMSDEDILKEAGEEDESKLEDAKLALIEKYHDEIYESLADPVNYFVNEQGMYSAEDLMKQTWITIDVNEAASAATAEDGWAHFLSLYSGDYETTKDGVVYFKE